MKVAPLVGVFISVGAVSEAVSPCFEAYKEKFAKSYANADEEARAKECWEAAIERIDERNAVTTGALFGENQFSDECTEEFEQNRLDPDMAARNGMCYYTPVDNDWKGKADLSKTTDHRGTNLVGPIKDQARCGSCWAFSATGTMEAAWAKAHGKYVALAEEELVACYKGNCGGDGADTAFKWVVGTHGGGMPSQASYPYTAGSGSPAPCKTSVASVAHFTSYYPILNGRSGDGGEERFVAHLQQVGPTSITVGASPWHDYKSGILTHANCPSGSTNHAVIAVGYNKNGNKPYWIVRNSWGTSWGENGYVRMSYGENTCAIATCYAYGINAASLVV